MPWDIINFDASAGERRTIIKSTKGDMKIISGFNAELFQAGNELEYGFKIESSTNESGTYSFTGKVELLKGMGYPGDLPYPRYKTTASGYNYGIQRN